MADRGRIIYRPNEDHRCKPPGRADRGVVETQEAEGTVWACECGEQYESRSVDRYGTREWVLLDAFERRRVPGDDVLEVPVPDSQGGRR